MKQSYNGLCFLIFLLIFSLYTLAAQGAPSGIPDSLDVKSLMQGPSVPVSKPDSKPTRTDKKGASSEASSPVNLGKPPVFDGKRLPEYSGSDYAFRAVEAAMSSVRGYIKQILPMDENIRKLKARAVEAAAETARIVAGKGPYMDEIRNGLFCSGCGKTKSEILSRGEQFPHSGQHILRPTKEQIDAKEREYDAKIEAAQRAETEAEGLAQNAGRRREDTVRLMYYQVALMVDGLRQEGGLLFNAFHKRKITLEGQIVGWRESVQAIEEKKQSARRTEASGGDAERLDQDKSRLTSQIATTESRLIDEGGAYNANRTRFFSQYSNAVGAISVWTDAWNLAPEGMPSRGIPEACRNLPEAHQVPGLRKTSGNLLRP